MVNLFRAQIKLLTTTFRHIKRVIEKTYALLNHGTYVNNMIVRIILWMSRRYTYRTKGISILLAVITRRYLTTDAYRGFINTLL